MLLKFINIVIRIFLIFLICFVWMRYFIDTFWLSVLYTALLTISIEFIIHFFLTRKKSKKSLKNEEEKLAEKISATFIFSHQAALDYFYKLSKINYSVKKLSKYIVITDKKEKKSELNEKIELNNDLIEVENKEDKIENKTILYPHYSYSSISPQNLVEILKVIEKQKATKLIVCGYKIESTTYNLVQKIKDIKIILLDSKNCYLKLIRPHNFFPDNLKDFSLQNKVKFKELLRASLSRKHSKGYFIASLILLFSSFIVRLNIYYVIMSSFLLLLSLLSFFLPRNQYKTEENIL